MKCEKCGFTPNPGDTICINCGAKLSDVNAIVSGLEKIQMSDDKNSEKKKK